MINKKFWDKEAENYRKNQWQRSNVAKFDYSHTKLVLSSFLRPSLKDSILEIGCGSGTWTKIISCKCKKLMAIDISEHMIQQAKKYVRSKNVKFVKNDFMKQKLKEKFDKIFAVRSLEYIKDKYKFITKIYNLLKPEGKIVIITKSKPCLWDLVYKSRWEKTKFTQEKITAKDLRTILVKIGFTDIRVQPVIIRLPIFVSGNQELPLVPKKYEKYVLRFFSLILNRTKNLPQEFLFLLTLISESYIISAIKK